MSVEIKALSPLRISIFQQLPLHLATSTFPANVSTGFSLGRLHMGGGGGQVQGDKALMGGTHEGGHRPYGGT